MIDYNDCWYQEVCKKHTRNKSHCRSCPKFIEMRAMLRQSNLPEKKWKPQQLIPNGNEKSHSRLMEIKSDIKNWVESGNNLYIYSESCGTGKTSWSIKLLQSYFDKVWAGNSLSCRGIFISVPSFLVKNKENISKFDEDFVNLREQLLDVDIVIWDDIAVTKLTEFEHALLLSYIDTRILNEKANIFTGNADKKVIETYLGERLASRVYSGSEVLQFTNRDMRGVNLW